MSKAAVSAPSVPNSPSPQQSLQQPNNNSGFLKNASTTLLILMCIAALPLAPHHLTHVGTLSLPAAVRFSPPETSWAKFPGRRDLQSMMRGLSTSWMSTAKSTNRFTAEFPLEKLIARNQVEFCRDASSGGDNILVRVLEGIGEILTGKRMADGNRSNMRNKKQHSIHRRLKAVDRDEQIDVNGVNGDEKDSLFSILSSHPLAASIFVFVGLISVVASFIASSDSRRLNRLAASYERRNITMDKEEAEILEFYEKKLESGSFRRMLSFDVDDEREEIQRSSPRSPEESSLQGTIALEYQDHEGDECDTEKEIIPDAKCDDVPSRSDVGCLIDASQSRSTQDSSDDFHDCDSHDSPQQSLSESLSSSISSLTSDIYFDKIELSSSFSTIDSDDADSPKLESELHRPPPPPPLDNSCSPLFSESITSSTANTILIQNIHCDHNISKDILRTQVERRVSFNPDVTVKEIPRRQDDEHVSSEKYLYFMLLGVGVLVAIFSYFPAHPSLSPIASMTRKELLRRADSMLSSQFDVEL